MGSASALRQWFQAQPRRRRNPLTTDASFRVQSMTSNINIMVFSYKHIILRMAGCFALGKSRNIILCLNMHLRIINYNLYS